jgi:glutamate-1-semialdehyde 2,1-aminomutase
VKVRLVCATILNVKEPQPTSENGPGTNGAGPAGFERSHALGEKASLSLAGGVSTAFRRSERPLPLVIRSAEGGHVTDVDGNEYVDFVCGYGPVILGHADPTVAAAVGRAAAGLQQVGAQTEDEFRLAELLTREVPSFERVRISLSGSEAVHAALRLARAVTGRSLVAKFSGHYHGWLDPIFAGTAHVELATESAGQVASSIADLALLPWNDRAALEQFIQENGANLAALIMEPYPCNGGVIPPEPGYLELARELTTACGALLIFDEVITGFRIGLSGAQGELGVMPDLTIVAKAMGNGFPVSAFGGRADIMELVGDNRVVHAGTYNAGGISVAAALATISRLRETDPYPRLRALGTRLRDGLVDTAHSHGHRLLAKGPGPVFFTWLLADGDITSFNDHLRADAAGYALVAQGLTENGVRVIPNGRWYLNAAHTESDVDRALAVADRVFAQLSSRLG